MPDPKEQQQLKKYAEDLAKIYKLEKEKRKRLEIEIGEKNKAKEELSQIHEFLESVMNSAFNSIFAFNQRGIITFFNRNVVELTGYSSSELQKKIFLAFFEKNFRATLINNFKKILTGEKQFFLSEAKIKLKNGTVRLISFSLSPLFEKGIITGIVGAAQDISEKKKLELQLLQSSKMSTLGEMATGVAHELNQPLNVIKMAAQMIEESIAEKDFDGDFLNDRVVKILSQVERATKVINHLRTFGRKSGEDFKPIDINQSIRNAFNMLAEKIKLHSIQTELILKENLPKIMGDSISIEQVFINLIINSIDALDLKASGGEKKISTCTISLTQEQKILVLFSDNGGGIPEEKLEKIFDAFFTTKESGKGTGLGLSISQSIITSHKGKIQAENTGEGAKFSIEFPSISEKNN